MESFPFGRVRRLELLRAEAAQIAVTTRPIVEDLDVVGQIRDGQLAVPVDLLLDPLFLQTTEE